ncbi:hypothetical protein BY458DRAFT_525818 [Sporodiniella umbellata]|nr:hypothetical protein BY458DRAFT_525818 [Sporodiniella umbellata]
MSKKHQQKNKLYDQIRRLKGEIAQLRSERDAWREQASQQATVGNAIPTDGDLAEEAFAQAKEWQEKYDDLYSVHIGYQVQIQDIEQAKAREIRLRAINQMLRSEIRERREEQLNLEYLKNVIIKFLEKKTTRPQLIPILSALLQCTGEDKNKLHRIVQVA